MPLNNDSDILKMAKLLIAHGTMNVFVVHCGNSKISNQCINEFSDDENDDLEFDNEEDAVLFDVGVISDNDDLEFLGAINNSQDIPVFEVGMKFTNCDEFKEAIRTYAVLKGCVLEWLKNDATSQRTHNCIKKQENHMANAVWLARYLKPKIDSNPMIKLRQLKDACKEELNLVVQTTMMKREKSIVLNELEGNYKEEYACLMGYKAALVEKNRENTVDVLYDTYINNPNPVFKSIYICLAACKTGWMEGCRRIIRIDACFLKGMCEGVLLTTVGIDGNKQMFPIAWAVVSGESNETWGWFLQLLRNDLNLGLGEGLVVMSDQHKAIISSVHALLPEAKHIFCVKHLDIAPRIKSILEENIEEGCTWKAQGSGTEEYEVSKGDFRFIVNMSRKECTCRGWNLTGIPCCHAICVMYSCNVNIEDGVAHWYRKYTYLQAYKFSIDCIEGLETWKLHKGLKLDPPPFKKDKGKPKVQRRKPAHETAKVTRGDEEKLSKKGVQMTCSWCGFQGHNKRGCPRKDDPTFKRDVHEVNFSTEILEAL
ncbi:hypothetical protein SLEP1_g59455 [Rubroshorea leprosula]|uniref:SWIM-type domain-containing protein n=1 Tax=Rubroshorea leprosula TaxID=152421 RepID=A0AAV5MWG5_9ROSI|nr:hypothetical protein SLEP1_g59455 [Rubroshorea leprosula]